MKERNSTQIWDSDFRSIYIRTLHRGDCHSLVLELEQQRRNIIDDIIIFHLTTDFRPDADADADVPTVFFRFRFVGIFLLVRFLRANVDIISVEVTVDCVWCLGQDELSRYCCGKLSALPYTQLNVGVARGRSTEQRLQFTSVIYLYCVLGGRNGFRCSIRN